MTSSDEELVSRSQRGDRQAFETLVRRAARLVYARLYVDTGDRHRAEDLTQETFLIAWRKIRQVSDARGFRAWLLAIAHNVLIDSGRHGSRLKRSTGQRDSDEQALLRTAGTDPPPPELAERGELRDSALKALRELPEEYRLPLMLRYLGEADYESISRQLGLSNGSLRGLLHRGLAMLRETMREKH